MSVKRLHHVSLIVADTDRSLAFYHGLLDLEVASNRPELGYRGAWLQLGEAQIHLMELPNPDPLENRPAHGGRDRHLAVMVDDFETLIQRLEVHNIAYTLSLSGRRALFCRDPDQNAVEIIAAPTETP
jgi:glyoxylase I family protein